MIRSDLMFLRRGVTFGRRLFRKILHVIRPRRFRTHSLFGERFNSIAQKRAAVLLDRSFDRALVVVNKEAAKIDILAAVLDLEKLKRADERVRGATADVALIFNRRTFFRRSTLLGNFAMRGLMTE